MPEPSQLTLAQAVQRAAEATDPGNEEPEVGELVAYLEDADEPITAIEDIEERMAEEAGAIDPEGGDPALAMATAVTVYLAHRRDAVGLERHGLLRLAARAEFDGAPPEHVEDWLGAEGVTV